MKKTMTCKNLITWGGKVCYGKLFEIEKRKDVMVAICNKCQKEYEIRQEFRTFEQKGGVYMETFVKNNDGLSVTFGDIPNGLVPEFKGIIYYFQTSFAKSTKEHNEAVESIIERVLSENDTNYTSWEVSKRETLVYTQISQVTVVSFRVRDAY